jgi:hypothetical protein
LTGAKKRLELKSGELAFTYCQVPVIFRRARMNSVKLFFADGSERQHAQLQLDAKISRSLFERTGQIKQIEVCLNLGELASFAENPDIRRPA